MIVAVFYGVYSWTRNQFGSNRIAADGVPVVACNCANVKFAPAMATLAMPYVAVTVNV